MWVEFYEDYYTSKPESALDDLDIEDDVQFITGDEEVDELERRIAEDDITQEEIQEMLRSWVTLPDEVAEEAETQQSQPDIPELEGFDDVNPRSK